MDPGLATAPRVLGVDEVALRRLAHVRGWARANGLNVSERGRISAEVMEKYEAAQ